jgi:small subunit ribosomal protein S11
MQNKKRNPRTAKQKNIQINTGHIYITATFNNTLITITNETGNTVCWGSTGKAGFKGSRKSTPFAATTTIDKVVQEAKGYGLKTVKLYIKGPGVGRDAALRVIRNSGLRVTQIADVTPIAHNGCRPKKRKKG